MGATGGKCNLPEKNLQIPISIPAISSRHRRSANSVAYRCSAEETLKTEKR